MNTRGNFNCGLLIAACSMAAVGVLSSGCAREGQPGLPSNDQQAANVQKVQNRQLDESGNTQRGGLKVTMALWSPSKDAIAAASLSDAQLDSIRKLEREAGAIISDLKRQEQRAKLRYVRSLSADPIDPIRVDEIRARAREAATAVLEAELDRVLKLRQLVSRDQWYELVMTDPKSVRIGGFTPRLLRVVDGEGGELEAPEYSGSRDPGPDPP